MQVSSPDFVKKISRIECVCDGKKLKGEENRSTRTDPPPVRP